MRISACDGGERLRPGRGDRGGVLGDESLGHPGGGVRYGQCEARLDQMRRHRRAHVAEADETDPGNGHCAAPVAARASASIAAKTSAALRNASSAAGPPQ